MPEAFIQKTFTKGIQAAESLLKQPTDGYKLFVNGRSRNNELRAIRSPVFNSATPDGLKQGLYAVDEYLVLFVAGAAYVTSVRGKTCDQLVWVPVTDFMMSETEPEIHFTLVPSSSINFLRDTTSGGFSATAISGSRAAGLAFDGVTQPHVLYPYTGGVTARKTQTYAEWDENGNREYVPIGKFPLYASPRLYVVMKDSYGLYTQIARSVSGRPMDFVVNIDGSNGTKNGDAETMSHYVSGDPLTGLFGLPTSDGSFLASTLKEAYAVVPVDDVDKRIFNEPIFRHRRVLPLGIVGHNAFADINGDTALISQGGIHSFNSVQNLQVESRNEPFSKEILPYINKPLLYGAAANFDDYALFAVDTVFGPGIAVYDVTTDSYPAIDLHKNLGRVKQFAVARYSGGQRCFAITADNKFCELYAHETQVETPRFYFGDFTAESAVQGLANQAVGVILTDCIGDTIVSARHFVNGCEVEQSVRTVPANESAAAAYPRQVPRVDTSGSQHKAVRFPNVLRKRGLSCGWEISWDNPNVAVTHVILEAAAEPATLDQQSDSVPQIITLDAAPVRFAAFGDSGPATANYAAMIRQITTFKPHTIIGLGDHIYENGTEEEYQAAFSLWPAGTRFKLAAGNHDLDGPAFKAHFGSQLYYSYRVGNVQFFILNAGYNTTSVQLTAPDRLNQVPTEEPDGNTATGVQARWLRTALAASTALFKVVVVHTPPYTSSSTYYPGYKNLDWPFKAWGASLVLSGHAHNYERLSVDGLPYIVCGTGGHSLVPFGTYVDPCSQYRMSSKYGYLRLTAYATTMVTEFCDVGGVLYDKYQLIG